MIGRPLAKTLVVPVVLFLCVFAGCATPAGRNALSGVKIICVWTVEATGQQAVDRTVEQAKELGFNAVCWRRDGLVASCHSRAMQAYALLNPLALRPEAQPQVLAPDEQTLPGLLRDSIPAEQFYQYGGEPAAGRREILDQNFTCPNNPGVVPYTLKRVAELKEMGYDGVIFDFVGYRNYRSCQCGLCLVKLEKFRVQHPELNARQAGEKFYENVLVDLYETLYRKTKEIAPGLLIANHIHPVYLPNVFYGHRVKADYCGVTVSWFFKPHWPLEKVRDYAAKVVSGTYAHDCVEPMPMIGIYTDSEYARDRRSPERLRQELQIIKAAGAKHLVACELGHILRDPETARVVREELQN